jgi:hypothetical protein
MYGKPGSGVTNFVLLGQVRCGASVIETSLNQHPQVICHTDLLAPDRETRIESHESYFGRQELAEDEFAFRGPYHPGLLSAEHYLEHQVSDQAKRGEKAVGVRLSYVDIERLELWDFLQHCIRSGDFAVIHVRRNPVVCYASFIQAVESGLFHNHVSEPFKLATTKPAYIEPEHLIDFCRQHAATERRVWQLLDDRLEIDYHELVLDYQNVMEHTFEYLGIAAPAKPVSAGTRRLMNRAVHERITDFYSLRSRVPHDVQAFFDADLF